MRDDALCEGVRILLKEAAGFLPLQGLGVVHEEDADHVILTYVDGFGAAAYRCRPDELPEAIRPGQAARALTPVDLDANPDGLFESKMLNANFAPDVQDEFRVHQAVALAVPDVNARATLVMGIADRHALTREQLSVIDRLAARVTDFIRHTPSIEDERERHRRLEAVAGMLPALVRVLDIREIFDHLSAIARDVVRHDFASVGMFSENRKVLGLFVQTSGGPWEFRSGPMPFPTIQTERWLFRFLDDLQTSPFERGGDGIRAGGHSSIRVAIRLEDRVIGALNFTSIDTAPYTATDLAVCRRIADFVTIALSHQRLAEEARVSGQLRERAANLALLDELLAALGDTGDISEIFERIAALAKKVLPHDALTLHVLLPDGRARRYSSGDGTAAQLPDIVNVPDTAQQPDWEFEVIDDVAVSTAGWSGDIAARGFRSALCAGVRLDEGVGAVLTFSSRHLSSFKPDDVLIARRIADRIALTLARERGRAATQRAEEATTRASQLESRVKALTDELDARTGFRRVVGDSLQWKQVLTQATQVAPTEATVLLLGESGTGKEVVARFVHRASPRRTGPFIALNCAALPEQLLEAELFGYERGAYTGATQSKPGQLEQAAGGTLFLDEVAEMSPSAQAKFLRVLQEREFQRLGGTRVLRTDARIVAATNRNLARAIATGQFREDLYYRLNVFAIQLPPLKDRRQDILPLSDAFLTEIGRGLGRPPAGISHDARKLLTEYHWPGNVRELRNILERAAILCEGGLITAQHLAIGSAAPTGLAAPSASPARVAAAAAAPSASPPAISVSDLESLERTMLEQALQNARFNKSKAAKALGLTRQQLYVRMRRHGLD